MAKIVKSEPLTVLDRPPPGPPIQTAPVACVLRRRQQAKTASFPSPSLSERLVVQAGFPLWCFVPCGRPAGKVLSHEFSLCLRDGVPSIVIWIAFFVGAIVGDALNDDFRIIATG